jgi:hypothetical protein
MALQAYRHSELPLFPDVVALASQLWLFSSMTLQPNQLPTAVVTVVRLYTNRVYFASLYVTVLHSVIRRILSCLKLLFYCFAVITI